MAFEEKMNEFIFSLRSSTNVQSCLAGLNSRLAGMLNHLSRFLVGSPSPEFVENPELVEVVKGST